VNRWPEFVGAVLGALTLPAPLEEYLGELKPFKFYAVAGNLGKLILSLLHKPAFFGASENFGQSHGHFGGYAALTVDQFRKGVARYPKSGGGACDRQARRLNALAQNNASGVWWAFHRHGLYPCLVVIDIVNVLRVTIKAKNHSPVGPNGHGPKTLHPAF